MTLRCARCLDSGLVTSQAPATPSPTVLADPILRFDAAEGVLRPAPCDCAAAAEGRALADAGERAALKAWIEIRLAAMAGGPDSERAA